MHVILHLVLLAALITFALGMALNKAVVEGNEKRTYANFMDSLSPGVQYVIKREA